MAINERDIADIVRSVLKGMANGETAAPQSGAASSGKLMGILIRQMKPLRPRRLPRKRFSPMPLEFREKIISNIRKKTLENAKMLSEMAVEETGMGNVGHKIIKHQLVAEKTSGNRGSDYHRMVRRPGTDPDGDGALGCDRRGLPVHKPHLYRYLQFHRMIAAGNSVVFMPHPSAKNCSNLAIDMVNRASVEVGGPANIATAVKEPTMDVSSYIFKHKDIDLLCATGGPGVVTSVLSSGKRAMGAGAGNPPVLVDETANIPKAAEDIINGCTFDNNLPCIAEKEVVAVDMIADELIYHMEQGRLLSRFPGGSPEADRDRSGREKRQEDYQPQMRREKREGSSFQDRRHRRDDIRCIIFEGEKTHPLIWTELMMPILGIVRVKMWTRESRLPANLSTETVILHICIRQM